MFSLQPHTDLSLHNTNSGPSLTPLNQYNRGQLLKIAEHYKIAVGDKRLKENVRAILKANLDEIKVFVPLQESPVLPDLAGPVFFLRTHFRSQGLSWRIAGYEIRKREKVLELEKMRQQAEFDKAVRKEQIRQQTEKEKLDLETFKLNLLKDGQMSDVSIIESARTEDHSRDVLDSLRLVPKFNEKEVETFFTLFERVVNARGWDDEDHTLLLQCVLTGCAQEAFASQRTVTM